MVIELDMSGRNNNRPGKSGGDPSSPQAGGRSSRGGFRGGRGSSQRSSSNKNNSGGRLDTEKSGSNMESRGKSRGGNNGGGGRGRGTGRGGKGGGYNSSPNPGYKHRNSGRGNEKGGSEKDSQDSSLNSSGHFVSMMSSTGSGAGTPGSVNSLSRFNTDGLSGFGSQPQSSSSSALFGASLSAEDSRPSVESGERGILPLPVSAHPPSSFSSGLGSSGNSQTTANVLNFGTHGMSKSGSSAGGGDVDAHISEKMNSVMSFSQQQPRATSYYASSGGTRSGDDGSGQRVYENSFMRESSASGSRHVGGSGEMKSGEISAANSKNMVPMNRGGDAINSSYNRGTNDSFSQEHLRNIFQAPAGNERSGSSMPFGSNQMNIPKPNLNLPAGMSLGFQQPGSGFGYDGERMRGSEEKEDPNLSAFNQLVKQQAIFQQQQQDQQRTTMMKQSQDGIQQMSLDGFQGIPGHMMSSPDAPNMEMRESSFPTSLDGQQHVMGMRAAPPMMRSQMASGTTNAHVSPLQEQQKSPFPPPGACVDNSGIPPPAPFFVGGNSLGEEGMPSMLGVTDAGGPPKYAFFGDIPNAQGPTGMSGGMNDASLGGHFSSIFGPNSPFLAGSGSGIWSTSSNDSSNLTFQSPDSFSGMKPQQPGRGQAESYNLENAMGGFKSAPGVYSSNRNDNVFVPQGISERCTDAQSFGQAMNPATSQTQHVVDEEGSKFLKFLINPNRDISQNVDSLQSDPYGDANANDSRDYTKDFTGPLQPDYNQALPRDNRPISILGDPLKLQSARGSESTSLLGVPDYINAPTSTGSSNRAASPSSGREGGKSAKHKKPDHGFLANISIEMQDTYERISPSEDDFEKRKNFLYRVEEMIRQQWPGCKLMLYGSSGNGFGLKKVDVDSSLFFEDSNMEFKDDSNTSSRKDSVSSLTDALEEEENSDSKYKTDEDNNNASEDEGEELTTKKKKKRNSKKSSRHAIVVKKLGVILERNKMKDVLPLPKTRVPIVKFRDALSGISCDICVENQLAILNTKLLRTYAAIDPRVVPFALIVKYWSKRRQINEPYLGTLSSYAFVMLVIYFFQTRPVPILPCLQRILPNGMEISEEEMDDCPLKPHHMVNDLHDCYFYEDLEGLRRMGYPVVSSKRVSTGSGRKKLSSAQSTSNLFKVVSGVENPSSVTGSEVYAFPNCTSLKPHVCREQNTENLGTLLSHFFLFFAHEFDYYESVISIRKGGLMTKVEKEWTSKQASRQDRYWMCIEDPFERSHNLGRVVDKNSLFDIRGEFMRGYRMLCEGESLADICREYDTASSKSSKKK